MKASFLFLQNRIILIIILSRWGGVISTIGIKHAYMYQFNLFLEREGRHKM